MKEVMYWASERLFVYNQSDAIYYGNSMAPPLTKDMLSIGQFYIDQNNNFVCDLRFFIHDVRMYYTLDEYRRIINLLAFT